MTSGKKTIHLVDGSGYIYRAYHAIRHLSNSQGLPTNATFGFANMLLKLLNEHNPEYLAMAFDTKGPTFRHDIYDAYKANRPPMPEDLSVQIPYIKQVVQAMNIATVELAGYEADDIIGTMAREAENKGFQVVMVTGDKDFKQLVSSATSIWDPMKDRATNYDSIKADFSIEPSKWVDVMALTGDTSDNVPGVPGIGEKTALELIRSKGDLDKLYQTLDSITKPKLHERLTNHKELAFLSRRLVEINRHVPISIDLDSLRVTPPNEEALASLFTELEFKRLLDRFSSQPGSLKDQTKAGQKNSEQKKYSAVLDEGTLSNLINELKQAREFSLDLETTSKDPMRASIVGLSFAYRCHEAFYIPIRHAGADAQGQLDPQLVLDRLKPILEDPSLAKIGQNIKYDWIVLQRSGIKLKGVFFDTMIASYLLNPNWRSHSLDTIAAEYLDHKTITFKEVAGTTQGDDGFRNVSLKDAVPYACEDADITLIAFQLLDKRLKDANLYKLFTTIEMPLAEVLVNMELTGIMVDRSKLERASLDFDAQLRVLQDRIYATAGEQFNIQSTQQLGRILFDKIGLSTQKKTKKTKSYATDAQVLATLAIDHELPALILQYRSLAKLKSTYADALVNLIHPETKRIHTSFNQTVTATGRLSSSGPNLQNIPVRTEEGRRIREAFVPKPGWMLLSADYSQIELRLLAHYTNDKILVDAFMTDQDIHLRTASEIFGLMPEMITADMRREAKVINFGIIYGMGAYRLANELGISQKMAKTYIDHYFQRYRGVQEFVDTTLEHARTTGKVVTLLGRERQVPDISSTNRVTREAAERIAINTPLQGSAADLIKIAMIGLIKELTAGGYESRLLLQVHDELVLEIPPDELTELTDLVRQIMVSAYKLVVPLKVDITVGENWAKGH